MWMIYYARYSYRKKSKISLHHLTHLTLYLTDSVLYLTVHYTIGTSECEKLLGLKKDVNLTRIIYNDKRLSFNELY